MQELGEGQPAYLRKRIIFSQLEMLTKSMLQQPRKQGKSQFFGIF
ncbi:hypothetical protein [Paenibacillus montaniterrae]|nr:hypothetical protein [Paenibacillus montaniterrae]